MNWHRLILTGGTKLPIAMVGRQIILMRGDIFAPATLSLIGLTTIRRVNARIDGRVPSSK